MLFIPYRAVFSLPFLMHFSGLGPGREFGFGGHTPTHSHHHPIPSVITSVVVSLYSPPLTYLSQWAILKLWLHLGPLRSPCWWHGSAALLIARDFFAKAVFTGRMLVPPADWSLKIGLLVYLGWGRKGQESWNECIIQIQSRNVKTAYKDEKMLYMKTMDFFFQCSAEPMKIQKGKHCYPHANVYFSKSYFYITPKPKSSGCYGIKNMNLHMGRYLLASVVKI